MTLTETLHLAIALLAGVALGTVAGILWQRGEKKRKERRKFDAWFEDELRKQREAGMWR